MKRLFYLILFVVILVFGISFAVKNPQTVDVQYYFNLHWNGSLSILLVIVLALGALLGVLMTSVWVLRARRQVSRAQREIKKIEQELANLRSLPIKNEV